MGITRDEKGRVRSDRPAELAQRPIPVRFQIELDKVLRELDNTSGYIRDAVMEIAIRDGLLDGDRS